MCELVKFFEDYASERGFGAHVVYVPEVGFATYHLNQSECYIEDIYVVPEKRKDGWAIRIADIITDRARASGIKELTGSINLKMKNGAKGRLVSTKLLISYGMTPCLASDDMIYFSKEI